MNYNAWMSKFGVIGGSAAHELLASGEFGSIIESRTVETPFGPAGPVHRMKFERAGVEFHYLSRHGDKGYDIAAPFVNYRANIYAMKSVGVERLVSWSGPGIISEDYAVGDISVPDDIIDMTKSREGTFYRGTGLGFIRLGRVFCNVLADGLCSVGGMGVRQGGVYVCTEGPRLETPAEIKMFRGFGGDFVGMTLVPEVFLARELEICCASICYLTNYAEGVKPAEFQSGELFEGLASRADFERVGEALRRIPGLIESLFSSLPPERDLGKCSCGRAMERYKKSGKISGNWKTWIPSPGKKP